MTESFQPRKIAHIADLIADYPLAWVVSQGPAGHAASPLPLLAETAGDGTVMSLFGHFARSNPQVDVVAREPAAMILFQGPQGYIPPRLVSTPGWGPTWNYAVVRFDVEIALVPDENGAALARLAAALERDQPQPWRPDMMGPRYAALEPHIVAFRATVRATHARFKLGQDETPDTFEEIVDGLGDGPLVHWMKKMADEEDDAG
jgi:transcriptional regulator